MLVIGLDYTTDSRYPETRITKFRSEGTARRWLDAATNEPAWPGSARNDIPAIQQNHHRRIRSAYVMPAGYRLSARDVRAVTERGRGSIYCRFGNDAKAEVYRRDAERRIEAPRRERAH